MSYKTGFKYHKNGKSELTPFEIFLKYSNEKEKSAALLSKILSRLIQRRGMTLLDIGSGNGAYLCSALAQVKNLKKITVTLLEPSNDLVKQLYNTAKLFPHNATVKIIHSFFEDFATDEQFDFILVSHVPLAKDDSARLPIIYSQMLKLLKLNGTLIVVLRERDDIHWFRTMFKSYISGKNYKSLTINDAEQAFKNIAKQLPLQLKKFNVRAHTLLPYPDNMKDVIAIIEFLLNIKWEEIPTEIHDSILNYLHCKHGCLRQTDSFLVVKRIYPQKKY